MFYLSSLSETRVQVSTIFYYDYDLAMFIIYVLYLYNLPRHSLDFKPIYMHYNSNTVNKKDIKNKTRET